MVFSFTIYCHCKRLALRAANGGQYAWLLVCMVCLCIHSDTIFAQEQSNYRIDSLKSVLQTQQGAAQYSTLIELCWEYRALNPKQSVVYGRQAIIVGRQFGITENLARAERFLGVAYRNLGDYGEAIEHFFIALSIDENNGENPVEIGHSLNSIGRIFILQKKPQEAIGYLERALTIAEKTHDDRLLAYCLSNIGDVRHLQGQYSEALGLLLRGLKVWEKIGAEVNIAATLSSIGLSFYELGDYKTAQEYYMKALALFDHYRQPHDMSGTLSRITSVYLMLGKPNEAKKYAEEAYRYAQQSQSRQQIKDALWVLAETAAQLQDYETSLEYHRLLKEASDSLYTEEAARQTAIYSARYDHERKAEQVALLEKETRQQELVRNILIGGGVLLLVSLVLLVNRFRLKQESEKMLEVRAAELAAANTQLRVAKLEIEEQNRMLLDLDKEKNEFLGIAAHDLKNPVSAIQGVAEMLQHDNFSQEQVKKLSAVILDNSRRMFELITNLLDVNAIESGKLALQPVVFSANVMLSGVIDRFEQPALLKNIRLELSLPEQHLYVLADKYATIQIIENLLSNAVKYSNPGQRISVRLTESSILQTNRIWTREEWLQMSLEDESTAEEFTEKCVRFEIQDFGPGLTEEDKAHLFTKFARLSAQPTAGEHSTGLGLSIVKKLTDTLGGRVWCESLFGYGATFIVELHQASTEQFQTMQDPHEMAV
ncbi:MAG: tetratricopeptide repeat-containing sensor histidine kinase [Candidatus Kapabacteria bacterium]|nr:tetratricopeptide repeat-containing sensor histidine kinase [Candidatus Kapabacteria bacterium]